MPTPDPEDGQGTLGQHGQPSSLTGATSVVAASAAAGAHDGSGFLKDRDPPPSYSGEEPETSFAVFEKNIKLWEFETDVVPAKRGVKLLRALSGNARMGAVQACRKPALGGGQISGPVRTKRVSALGEKGGVE